MSEPGQKMYFAHLTERATIGDGMGLFTTSGEVTLCGQWVEQRFTFADPHRNNVIRHRLDRYWGETPEEAMAAQVDKIRAIARRMLEQADQIEENAKRPALAEAGSTHPAAWATSRE